MQSQESRFIIKRIQVAISPWKDVVISKIMFGGTCFLYKGKMCASESKGRLMVRVMSSKMERAIENPDVLPMDFTGKVMKEFIFVSEEGFDTEEKLQNWVELGIEHAKSKING